MLANDIQQVHPFDSCHNSEAIPTPNMAEHKPVWMAIIIITNLVYVATLGVNFLSGWQMEDDDGNPFWNVTTGEARERFYLEINPASWTFSVVWATIYLWQAAWLIYGLTTLCRRTDDAYLYVDPPLVPISVYLIFIVNLATNMSWLFVFRDPNNVEYGLGIIMLMAVTLYAILIILAWKIRRSGQQLIKQGQGKEIWLTRIFVQNGIALYGAWISIATLLNFGIVLISNEGVMMHQKTVSSICLGILAFDIIVYFCMDVFVFDSYLRYQFSPYVLVNVALCGVLHKNWDPESRNCIFTLTLLSVGSVLMVVKSILMFWRHRSSPIFSTKS